MPGKQMGARFSSVQTAAIARVRCAELNGASVTRSSVSVTARSAADASADWMSVRPSSAARG